MMKLGFMQMPGSEYDEALYSNRMIPSSRYLLAGLLPTDKHPHLQRDK